MKSRMKKISKKKKKSINKDHNRKERNKKCSTNSFVINLEFYIIIIFLIL